MIDKEIQLILASKSPRRIELLERMGLRFKVMPANIEEIYPADMPAYEVPEFLAEQKVEHIWNSNNFSQDTVILGADSIVILGDVIYEKPKDPDDAFRMLAALSGKTHLVITGVCLKSAVQRLSFSGKSWVTFRPMDKDEIEQYIESAQPFDKAGSYGIQDWIGMCKVSEIRGTYTNIMGLPTDLVYEGLRQIKLGKL